MEPPDHTSDTMDGAACAACGLVVPADRVRVLARRDDLTFAELPCSGCGSTGLAIFLADGNPDAEEAAAAPATATSPRPGQPVSADDVIDMHLFLAGWTGDARGLVEPPGGRGAPRA